MLHCNKKKNIYGNTHKMLRSSLTTWSYRGWIRLRRCITRQFSRQQVEGSCRALVSVWLNSFTCSQWGQKCRMGLCHQRWWELKKGIKCTKMCMGYRIKNQWFQCITRMRESKLQCNLVISKKQPLRQKT
jgi:hypothetical protein